MHRAGLSRLALTLTLAAAAPCTHAFAPPAMLPGTLGLGRTAGGFLPHQRRAGEARERRGVACLAWKETLDRVRLDKDQQPRLKKVVEGVCGVALRILLGGAAQGLKIDVKASSNRQVKFLAATK